MSDFITNAELRIEAERLCDENERLRKRVKELEELLPENGRWFSAEIVEAYATECTALKTLAAEMLKEHERIYHTCGVFRPISATNEQMAHWHSVCQRWEVEVPE